MPSSHFDLIICDIDGCLSPESTAPIDLATLASIAQYSQRAHAGAGLPPITLCTGRPQPFAEAMCRMIDVRRMPCVCENGAWLYERETNQYLLDPSITPDHIACVRVLSDWISTAYGEPRRDLNHHVGVTQQPGKAASVSLYHPDTAYLKSLMPALEAQIARADWPIRVSATWLYINLDLVHISKGTGLDRLLSRIRGVSPGAFSRDRLLGIGDTTSDLPIRERCGFFACPANAQDEMKRLADYVSPFDEVQGVIDVLSKIETGQLG